MVDTVYDASTDDKVIFRACQLIQSEKPNFLFLHFDEPDGKGHNFGHGTPEYYEHLKISDDYLSQIRAALKQAGIEKETLIIVTADHGGIGKGHGGITMQEMQTPVVFSGKGVKQQAEMQQSIMIYDIGATIAWLYDQHFRQVWIGRPIKEAFNKS